MANLEDCQHDCEHQLRPDATGDGETCILCGCNTTDKAQTKAEKAKSADANT